MSARGGYWYDEDVKGWTGEEGGKVKDEATLDRLAARETQRIMVKVTLDAENRCERCAAWTQKAQSQLQPQGAEARQP